MPLKSWVIFSFPPNVAGVLKERDVSVISQTAEVNGDQGPVSERRLNKLNSELIYPQVGNSEFLVPEKLICVSSVNSE